MTDTQKLKEFAKIVSVCISELASSLNSFVEDETDPVAKAAYRDQIESAEKLAADLDEMIFRIAIGK